MVKLRKYLGKGVPKVLSVWSLEILIFLENNIDKAYTKEDIINELTIPDYEQASIPLILIDLEIQEKIERKPENELDGTINFYNMAKEK